MALVIRTLAAVGSTSNHTHDPVGTNGAAGRVAIQFVVEAVGATPTVTWKAQGSLDGVNWYDVLYNTDSSDTEDATVRVATALGAQVEWVDPAGFGRFYSFFRVITTLNTNVTYRAELYADD